MSQLTTSEAAQVLGVSPDRIRQLARSGELRSTTTPYGRLFDRTDVERLAQHRRKQGPPADKAIHGPGSTK